jgi:hypothetical protein
LDNIQITTYAPVAIPTLNRYEKLKRLLESLENNSLAKYTEIFISVDYPPEDKYVEGYNQIIKYLNENKLNFKKTNIFFQESNLGAFQNSEFLGKVVFERFDRVISLEDDNEVSLNFLEYMNKALEYGKDKPDICCISAFSGNYRLPRDIKGTAFKSQFLSWGTALWRDKNREMANVVNVEWLEDIINDWKKLFLIYRKSRTLMVHFGTHYILNPNPNFYIDGRIYYIDIIYELYMIFNNKYSIMPTISKIRNYGADGSGQNCIYDKNQLDVEHLQKLDTEETFEFILDTVEKRRKKIQRYIRNKSKFGHSEFMALKVFLYCVYYVKVKNAYKGREKK